MAVRGLGCPVRFTLTAGQKGDAPQPSQPSSYGCDKCPHHLVHDLIEPTIEPGKAALKDSGLQPSDIALRPIELPNCSLHASLPECCASAATRTRLHGLRWFFSREGGRAQFAR
jgi:hypothetical protein